MRSWRRATRGKELVTGLGYAYVRLRPLPMGGTMDDDRNPEKDHGPPDPTGPPDGYHAVPEGYGNVEFLDEDGRPMSRQEWLKLIEDEADEQ